MTRQLARAQAVRVVSLVERQGACDLLACLQALLSQEPLSDSQRLAVLIEIKHCQSHLKAVRRELATAIHLIWWHRVKSTMCVPKV
jgi:hypothetical protein